MEQNRDLILPYYSPYNFLRNVPVEKHLGYVKDIFLSYTESEIKRVAIKDSLFEFYVKKLEWDSNFFEIPIFKIFTFVSENHDLKVLVEAIDLLVLSFPLQSYIFVEAPSEDTMFLQALGACNFKLIETRLTYFHNSLKNYSYKRFNVRKATTQDTDGLKRTAKVMKNVYDRIHADKTFGDEIANKYLETYIENSIHGFADIVLVPNELNVPCEAFLTANINKSDWDKIGYKISKMALSAVNSSCKGWYVKLISEMTFLLKEEGADCIFMNTQSTNRAVIKTWEGLGYSYGNATHIFAKTI